MLSQKGNCKDAGTRVPDGPVTFIRCLRGKMLFLCFDGCIIGDSKIN